MSSMSSIYMSSYPLSIGPPSLGSLSDEYNFKTQTNVWNILMVFVQSSSRELCPLCPRELGSLCPRHVVSGSVLPYISSCTRQAPPRIYVDNNALYKFYINNVLLENNLCNYFPITHPHLTHSLYQIWAYINLLYIYVHNMKLYHSISSYVWIIKVWYNH